MFIRIQNLNVKVIYFLLNVSNMFLLNKTSDQNVTFPNVFHNKPEDTNVLKNQ